MLWIKVEKLKIQQIYNGGKLSNAPLERDLNPAVLETHDLEHRWNSLQHSILDPFDLSRSWTEKLNHSYEFRTALHLTVWQMRLWWTKCDQQLWQKLDMNNEDVHNYIRFSAISDYLVSTATWINIKVKDISAWKQIFLKLQLRGRDQAGVFERYSSNNAENNFQGEFCFVSLSQNSVPRNQTDAKAAD